MLKRVFSAFMAILLCCLWVNASADRYTVALFAGITVYLLLVKRGILINRKAIFSKPCFAVTRLPHAFIAAYNRVNNRKRVFSLWMFLIILFYIPFVNGLRSTFVFYFCCILPCLIGYFASNSLAFCSLIKSCCSGDLSQISSATFCNSKMGISLSISCPA